MNFIEFRDALTAAKADDKKIQQIYKSIADGDKVNFLTATKYAKQIGVLSSDVLTKLLGADFENMPWDEAIETLFPSLCYAYEDVAAVSASVQQSINVANGFNIKALSAETDKNRIFNMLEKIADTEQAAGWLIGDDVLSNLMRSAVTSTIERNAEFLENAGGHAYLSRTAVGGCCDWCDTQCGVFEFGKQPEYFWAVHKDCNCVIDYVPSKERRSRVSFETRADGTLRKITKIF